jgi:hypothetical protein
MIEAVRTSETSVYSQGDIPEGSNLHTSLRENLKSHNIQTVCFSETFTYPQAHMGTEQMHMGKLPTEHQHLQSRDNLTSHMLPNVPQGLGLGREGGLL